MFEWFTQQFSTPRGVAVVLGARFLTNFLYAGLVVTALGARSRLGVVSVVLAVVSVAVTLLVLYPGGLPNTAGYVDVLIHFTLPVIAGYAVYTNPSDRRWIVFGVLVLLTLFLFTSLLLLYGDAP